MSIKPMKSFEEFEMNKTLSTESKKGFARCFLEYNNETKVWDIYSTLFYDTINDIARYDWNDYESIVFPIYGCEGLFEENSEDSPLKDFSINNVLGSPIALYVIKCTDQNYDYESGDGLCPIAVYICEKAETITLIDPKLFDFDIAQIQYRVDHSQDLEKLQVFNQLP